MTYPENLEKFQWDYHTDRTGNDYRSKDDKPTQYPENGFATKEEEESYYEKIDEVALDTYPF